MNGVLTTNPVKPRARFFDPFWVVQGSNVGGSGETLDEAYHNWINAHHYWLGKCPWDSQYQQLRDDRMKGRLAQARLRARVIWGER